MRMANTYGLGIDDVCEIAYCECGKEIHLSICGGWVTRCPECNRGYIVEYKIMTFSPKEKHKDLLEKQEFYDKLEKDREELKRLKLIYKNEN